MAKKNLSKKETTLPLLPTAAELFAPCGMFCGFCVSYLSMKYQIPKRRGIISYCSGCRLRDKQCSFIKKRCDSLLNHKLDSCSACTNFPCETHNKIEQSYKSKAIYPYSFQESLREIQAHGPEYVIGSLKKAHGCKKCGEILCIHNGLCFHCDQDQIAVMKNYRNDP